jgi:hypothetical protein
MSLETIMQFDHLASVHDFIDNVIPEMLTENFIPRTKVNRFYLLQQVFAPLTNHLYLLVTFVCKCHDIVQGTFVF